MSKKDYMFIFHGGSYDGLSPDEVQKNMEKWFGWIEKLRNKGVYKAGEALEKTGKMLSQKNGKYIVDGPFAESKELVGGFFIVEAGSLDEAVEMAKDYPDFSNGGSVQVREVRVIPEP
ncbi:MAG: YciI family protein [Ignavibacteriae bacterium]|nr:YciI family protein [Ignavibacteriota bacterium]